MADIAIGASITGSLTSSDQKDADGTFYDEYNIKLTDNRVLTFALELPTSTSSKFFEIINTVTGEKNVSYLIRGGSETISAGLLAGDYKLRISSFF